MRKRLDKIEDYFPYVRHRLALTKKSLGIVWYKQFSDWLFSGKTFEGFDRMVEYVKTHPDHNVIKVGRHLSEGDWAEAQYQFVTHGLETIIQSGHNLFVGPFDPLLRSAGAFAVFREETSIYHQNWIMNMVLGFLDEQFGIELTRGVDITKKLGEEIYKAYFAKSLDEGYNVLMFPEYSEKREGDGKRTIKYGRSYSGELLPFSPIPLQAAHVFQKTHPEKTVVFYPCNISYERVPEDENFARLDDLKERGASSKRVYAKDYWWNLTFRAHQNPFRVHLAFGEPIPIGELPQRGVLSRRALAPYLRKQVGALSVPYATQLMGLALEQGETKIKSLKCNMQDVRDRLQEVGDQYVRFLPEDMDLALEEAHAQFWKPTTRKIARFDGERAKVYRQDVLLQYANHARHLLEE